MTANRYEHWPIDSREFKQWLTAAFFKAKKKTPSTHALQDAINTLCGKAVYDGKKYDNYVRVAEHDGCIYLDLCDEKWRAVRITAKEWSVVDDPPVRFRRPPAMRSLPIPCRGGSLRKLRQFVNAPDEETFILLVSWLLGTFMPKGPYPILMLNGEQGSAKTTTCRMLRNFVDPNDAPLRAKPRNEHELMISADNAWVMGFDNLSGVKSWFSDALCRIASGGGFATRKLYTNQDESIITVQRPIMLNGIEELASRSDLLDRAIPITLAPVREKKRKAEAAVWVDFERAASRILGALLDAVVMALRRISRVRLKEMPRMADFAKWIVAAEPALPWKSGRFLEVYAANRSASNDVALEASPVAEALVAFLAEQPSFEGAASELLGKLKNRVRLLDQTTIAFPKRANLLSNHLRRLAPNLRGVGVDVQFVKKRRHGGKRLIRIACRSVETACNTVSHRHPKSKTSRKKSKR